LNPHIEFLRFSVKLMKLIAVYFEEGDENQENQPNDQSVERTD
jgi:hypothetical protein